MAGQFGSAGSFSISATAINPAPVEVMPPSNTQNTQLLDHLRHFEVGGTGLPPGCDSGGIGVDRSNASDESDTSVSPPIPTASPADQLFGRLRSLIAHTQIVVLRSTLATGNRCSHVTLLSYKKLSVGISLQIYN